MMEAGRSAIFMDQFGERIRFPADKPVSIQTSELSEMKEIWLDEIIEKSGAPSPSYGKLLWNTGRKLTYLDQDVTLTKDALMPFRFYSISELS